MKNLLVALVLSLVAGVSTPVNAAPGLAPPFGVSVPITPPPPTYPSDLVIDWCDEQYQSEVFRNVSWCRGVYRLYPTRMEACVEEAYKQAALNRVVCEVTADLSDKLDL